MDVLKLICLITGMTGGLISTSYQIIAGQKGWTIGKWFLSKPPSWFVIISFLLLAAACVMSFQQLTWWEAILLVIFSWFLAAVTTFSLKSLVQYLSLLLTLTSVVLYFISFATVYKPEKLKIQSVSSEMVSNNEGSQYDTSSAKAGLELNTCTNSEILNSRKLVIVKSDEDKRKVIYLFCVSILNSLNQITVERDKLDSISVNNLQQGKKVNYNNLFKKIDAAIKKIENRNQMPETNLLDQLAFCRLEFEKERYGELENLINNNYNDTARTNKIKFFFSTYSSAKDEKDRKLNAEVEKLINKYDLKNVSL